MADPEWSPTNLKCNSCGHEFQVEIPYNPTMNDEDSAPIEEEVTAYSGVDCPVCGSNLIGPAPE